MNSWQPIESAPTDGTKVLLFTMNGVGHVEVGYWSGLDNMWDRSWSSKKTSRLRKPSHWMPLPVGPSEVK